MDRTLVKTLSAGQFVIQRRGEPIDQKQLDSFIDGALYAYDLLMKIKNDEKKINQIDQNKNAGCES